MKQWRKSTSWEQQGSTSTIKTGGFRSSSQGNSGQPSIRSYQNQWNQAGTSGYIHQTIQIQIKTFFDLMSPYSLLSPPLSNREDCARLRRKRAENVVFCPLYISFFFFECLFLPLAFGSVMLSYLQFTTCNFIFLY